MKRGLITITVLIAVLSSFYFGVVRIYAYESGEFGRQIQIRNFSLSGQGNFSLTQFQKDKVKSWILTKYGLWSNININLIGFEDSVDLCRENIHKIDDTNILCLKGYVGAHAENIALVDLAKFQLVKFDDGVNTNYNVISDEPLFSWKESDPRKFVTDMRNYDKNPLSDSIRSYYRWDKDRFIFDKLNNITYDKKNIVIEGEL